MRGFHSRIHPEERNPLLLKSQNGLLSQRIKASLLLRLMDWNLIRVIMILLQKREEMDSLFPSSRTGSEITFGVSPAASDPFYFCSLDRPIIGNINWKHYGSKKSVRSLKRTSNSDRNETDRIATPDHVIYESEESHRRQDPLSLHFPPSTDLLCWLFVSFTKSMP